MRGYWEVNEAVVREMHRQVGDLVIGADGIARRHLLMRHLVLPDDLANTVKVLTFIADEISRDTSVNILRQYYPCYRGLALRDVDTVALDLHGARGVKAT